MKRPAVFIDRDGTINEQLGYINHESRFVIFPFVGEAVKRLNDNGFLAIVITNQSGIGRGYYPEALVLELHNRLKDNLAERGARLDRILTGGYTALMQASAHGNAELAELLLGAGADVLATSTRGKTALTEAASGGFADVVEVLTAAGARADEIAPAFLDSLLSDGHIAASGRNQGILFGQES